MTSTQFCPQPAAPFTKMQELETSKMLLYTRVAQPKEPKRRSRSGCVFCKEKKKKCDEAQPSCSRCVEKGEKCVYESVKPRRRWKKNSGATTSSTTIDTNATRKTSSPPVIRENVNEKLADIPSPISQEDEEVDEDFSRDTRLNVMSLDVSDKTSYTSSPDGNLSFTFPVFMEFSPNRNHRMLIDHFCNIFSHLIVFREDMGNPFQQLVLPLCSRSSVVMNAVYALASAHLENRGLLAKEPSHFFHSQTLAGLTKLISHGMNNIDCNELLASIMLLVYFEVLVQKERSTIVTGHLKGALSIMDSVSLTEQDGDPTFIFLKRAFQFYDVIAALSFGSAPLTSPPSPEAVISFPDTEHSSPLKKVDSLLGMFSTLWPIIHRLSNLKHLKTQAEAAWALDNVEHATELQNELSATSTQIEAALEDWQPSAPIDFYLEGEEEEKTSDFECSHLRSIVNNSLAYRHSASVYLQRSIYGHPTSHPLVQKHAHAALIHCLATVRNQGPASALLWPLFVAACEATSSTDRCFAERVFLSLQQRQGMANIENAWAIVQGVWQKTDDTDVDYDFRDVDELWRSVSSSIGVSIVFG